MNLSRALRLDSSLGKSIAFVGAGGKTTAMFQLARELIELPSTVLRPRSVFVTASSHLGVWQIPLADHHIIAKLPEEIGAIPEGVILFTSPIEGDRTQPINSSVLSWLREIVAKEKIPLLIEADGSRGLPLKAPAAHEPPIPDFMETVVVVAGLSGLQKPIADEFVFRSERFREISGASEEQTVTPEMLARVLTHPEGGLKNIPAGARRVALLNQAETPELQAIGGKIAHSLLSQFDSVLVGSLHQNDFHTFERTAGIILAAGESKRFGKPKQLLDWRGETFVHAVTGKALEAGLSPVIVVTGAEAEKVEGAVKELDAQIVRNEEWQSGQASSIVAGVRALISSPKFGEFGGGREGVGGCLFLLADQPQIPVEVIRALAEVHAQNLPSILAPLVQEEKRANPVLFDRVTFPDLLTLTGDVGGRAIFDKHKVEYLPWHNETLLFDVDTPEDYERLTNSESNVS